MISEIAAVGGSDAQALDVVSDQPGVPGEVLAVELAGGGTAVSLIVCVAESRPVVSGTAVGHALRLVVLDETRRLEGAAAGADARPAHRAQVLAAADVIGALVRESDVYVLNTSGSGCLVESASPVGTGSIATLTLRTADGELSDHVRVTRCDRIEGAGSRYLLGVEFLWTSPPRPGCLRRAARDPGRTAARPADNALSAEPRLVM